MNLFFLAPEMFTGKACADMYSAWINETEMRPFAERDQVEWERMHAFFANMGGFVVRFGPELIVSLTIKLTIDTNRSNQNEEVKDRISPSARQTEGESPNGTGIQKASTVVATLNDQTREPSNVSTKDLASLPPHRITPRSRMAILEDITPNYSARCDVSSVAKDSHIGLDAFTKRNSTTALSSGVVEWKRDDHNSITVSEVIKSAPQVDRLNSLGWYWNMAALQGNIWALDGRQLLLAREMGIIDALPNVPTDSLNDRNKVDVVVRCFTVLQILWLAVQIIVRSIKHLPSSQLEIVTLAFAACSIVTYLLQLQKPQGPSIPYYIPAVRYPTENEILTIAAGGPRATHPCGGRPFYSIPNAFVHYQGTGVREFIPATLGVVLFSIAFGALHLIAWQFSFPTDVERLLWRIASIGTAIIPVSCTLPILLVIPARVPKWMSIVIIAYTLIGTLVYSLCRLFTLVEVFRTLYFLPPGAYITTWAANIPHIG
jgi:hypothetical protein